MVTKFRIVSPGVEETKNVQTIKVYDQYGHYAQIS